MACFRATVGQMSSSHGHLALREVEGLPTKHRRAWREVGRGAGKGRGTGHTPAGRGPGLGQEPWWAVVRFLTGLEGELIGLVSGFTVEGNHRSAGARGSFSEGRGRLEWDVPFLGTVIWRCLCQRHC